VCRLVLATTFINAFGEGLALRGPVGSMVQAIDGMAIEQEKVVTGFNAAVRISFERSQSISTTHYLTLTKFLQLPINYLCDAGILDKFELYCGWMDNHP